ncbi:spermidine/putrescine ABC transporter membrane protein [Caballeronia telluris]|uniref:Spermidine/putrescine ABC transporter membrane protein n=1 Tax=Caballeronia telluris TaxID=326475 RepID=A0A158EQ77_9BURK|nr:spermidine/putrescine ABC transporter membrane protein [Caballeronia telluris]
MKMCRLVVSSVSHSVHSNATGASAMRGGATRELATGVSPTEASSLTFGGKRSPHSMHLLRDRLVGQMHDELARARDVVLPLSKTGIVIGSIFVITIVMGDFLTVGVMGGQQIASVGKIIQVQTGYLQFPAAAANAVVLLAVVLMIVWALTRVVDIRKEL